MKIKLLNIILFRLMGPICNNLVNLNNTKFNMIRLRDSKVKKEILRYPNIGKNINSQLIIQVELKCCARN